MLNFNDHMNKEVGKIPWKNVRLLLRQPHARKKQMGLKFVRFGTEKNLKSNPSSAEKHAENSEQNSSFFKMMHSIIHSGKNSDISTGIKCLNDSSSCSSMTRTAKMLKASKAMTSSAGKSLSPLSAARKHNNGKNRNSLTPNRSRTEEVWSEKAAGIKSPSTSCGSHKSKKLLKYQDEKSASEKPSNESQHQRNDLGNHLDGVSPHRPATKNLTPNSIEGDSSSNQPDDDDVIMTDCDVQQPVFTDKQVKQLKRAINRFFNKLDIDKIDLATVKVKDLRKKFESTNDVKLNSDGRKHFRDVTINFVNVVQMRREHRSKISMNQNRGSPLKRKSSDFTSETNIGSSTSAQNSQTPSKIAKTLSSASTSQLQMVQCPICTELFDSSIIESHAAVCGEVIIDEAESSHHNEPSSYHTEQFVDCSETSCLTPVQQQLWINYSKEPKPYQERLNTSDYAGCKLVKCPSCGQKYKLSEIEQHSDECAEKVNSRSTKMGLYYVNNTEKTSKKTKRKNLHKTGDVFVID